MARQCNPGWFRRGHDPRRRVFSAEECRAAGKRGFAAALDRHGGQLLSWLYLRVKGRDRRSIGGPGDSPRKK